MTSRTLRYAQAWSEGKKRDASAAIAPKFVTGEFELYNHASRGTAGNAVIYRDWVIFQDLNELHPPVFVRSKVVIISKSSFAVATSGQFQTAATVMDEPEFDIHRGQAYIRGVFVLSTRRNLKFVGVPPPEPQP